MLNLNRKTQLRPRVSVLQSLGCVPTQTVTQLLLFLTLSSGINLFSPSQNHQVMIVAFFFFLVTAPNLNVSVRHRIHIHLRQAAAALFVLLQVSKSLKSDKLSLDASSGNRWGLAVRARPLSKLQGGVCISRTVAALMQQQRCYCNCGTGSLIKYPHYRKQTTRTEQREEDSCGSLNKGKSRSLLSNSSSFVYLSKFRDKVCFRSHTSVVSSAKCIYTEKYEKIHLCVCAALGTSHFQQTAYCYDKATLQTAQLLK